MSTPLGLPVSCSASICRFLLYFGFAGGSLAPDFNNFFHKEIALPNPDYSNTKCLQNSPGKASLCLIGRWRERVDKYFNEVRKLGKCFKAENTAFVFARIPHLQMN